MVLYAFIYNIRLCYKMSSLGLLKSFVKKNTADIKKNTAEIKKNTAAIKAIDGQQDVLKISIKENFDTANGKPTFTDGFLHDQDGNYIRRGYAQIPILDNSDKVIGHEVNDSVIQKQSTNNYMYRLNTTYHFENIGTVNTLFHFNIEDTDGRFPVGRTIQGDIISGSGRYLGKTGTVTVVVTGDKTRDIHFVIHNKKGYDGVSTGGMFGDTFYSHSLPPITLGDKPFYPVVVDKPDLGDSGFPILPPLYTESTPEPRDLT